ncbi:cysteine-rich protein [Stevia carlavirus 1]|uniref:RNA silencing suppressor n=1 Tax=Stevia carlavirus 1 TaxID=2794421 RepID=A0AAE9P4Y4_9VIRU|nr:cysteine-rich protein [Stevia carlavirus 1]
MKELSDKGKVILILCNVFAERGPAVPLPIVVNIYKRAGFLKVVGNGTSTYARRRRAYSIGRCERCYRVYPPLWFSKKCDNRTCVPGISSNMKVVNYIKYGSSRGDTHSGCNF